MVYDSTRNAVIDDVTMEKIAKAQIDGDDLPVTKSDWMIAIEERADEIYADRGMTKEQRFSKAIGGEARSVRGTVMDGGDRLCKFYYEAMKIAPREEMQKSAPEAPADVAKALAKRAGPASERMLQLARAHRTANPGLSEAQAYDRVYTDRANVGLKNQMDEEAWSLRNVGDTRYNARNNPFGRTTGATTKKSFAEAAPPCQFLLSERARRRKRVFHLRVARVPPRRNGRGLGRIKKRHLWPTWPRPRPTLKSGVLF